LHYLSTRGLAPKLPFDEVVLTGLAADGGLYVPSRYPTVAPERIAAFAGSPYAETAQALIAPFAEGLPGGLLEAASRGAYASFSHAAVAPLVQIGDNLFVLELFHGPTLAFKDLAMQLLGRLMDALLEQRGLRATIVGATSGDTGAAAIEAFRGRANVDVFILYPDGRVSDVQRRQMTTVAEENVHAIALSGSFDDAQTLLKGLFRDEAFRSGVGLAGVNSINWARVVAQMVYYFTSGVALGAPHRKISFAVPTGNFGDVLAGYVAKRMGLPIERLIVATNENDILARALATGRYEPRGVRPTQSPSMDIQLSSNFERLLFDAVGRDPESVSRAFATLERDGGFEIPRQALETIRADFDALAVNEAETEAEIARTYRESGYVIDPHTATGVRAARARLEKDDATPVIALSTAHPAKFPEAIERAIGLRIEPPPRLAPVLQGRERIARMNKDFETVKHFILDHARAARVGLGA
jgi:threonine synthase